MKPPKRWKTAIVIWIAIYPTITLLFFFFGKNFAAINPLPLRTLVITAVVVPLMVYLVIPLVQRLLVKWLQK